MTTFPCTIALVTIWIVRKFPDYRVIMQPAIGFDCICFFFVKVAFVDDNCESDLKMPAQIGHSLEVVPPGGGRLGYRYCQVCPG